MGEKFKLWEKLIPQKELSLYNAINLWLFWHTTDQSPKMSSAVGLNILPPPISTTGTVVSSPLPTQNDTSDKTNLELNDINHGNDQKVSKCIQMENNKEESDSNHNSEQNEGMKILF